MPKRKEISIIGAIILIAILCFMAGIVFSELTNSYMQDKLGEEEHIIVYLSNGEECMIYEGHREPVEVCEDR